MRGQCLLLGHAYVVVGADGPGGRGVHPAVLGGRGAVRRRFGPAVRVQLGRLLWPLRRVGSQVRVAVRGRILEQRGRVAAVAHGRQPGRGVRGLQRGRGRRRHQWRHRVQVVQAVGRDVTVAAGREPIL